MARERRTNFFNPRPSESGNTPMQMNDMDNLVFKFVIMNNYIEPHSNLSTYMYILADAQINLDLILCETVR